jgi:hypothetical protein
MALVTTNLENLAWKNQMIIPLSRRFLALKVYTLTLESSKYVRHHEDYSRG